MWSSTSCTIVHGLLDLRGGCRSSYYGMISMVATGSSVVVGAFHVVDPLVVLHGNLCIYSTSANLTVAYNMGAMVGVMFGVQVASGVCIAMSYVASEVMSFPALDQCDTIVGGSTSSSDM